MSQAWDGAAVAKGSTVTYTPNVPAGTTDSRLFTISNVGSAPLTISNPSSLVSGTGWSLIETPPSSIAAGSSGTFRVRIFSSAGGTFTGTVSIASNDTTNNPYTFSVRATVDPPPGPPAGQIQVSQAWDGAAVAKGSTVTYTPNVPAGITDSRLFRISNVGGAPLTISNPSSLVSGTGWSLIETPPSSIAAGSSGTFRVRIFSNTGGTFTGTVSIASNDTANNPYTFSVKATVASTAPDIRVTQAWDGVEVPAGSTFAFPDLDPGVADSRLFRIFNDGPGVLHLANPPTLVSGPCFSQIETPASLTLQVGQSTTFRVRLSCATAGVKTGSVSISSDDPVDGVYSFSIRGRVGSLPPFRVVSSDGQTVSAGGTYALPDTGVGVSVSRLFTLFNDGASALSLASPGGLVSGAGFSQIDNPPASPIAAGGSTQFRVRLLHSVAGAYHGAVTIETTDPGQRPFTFNVTGNVGNPDFSLSANPTVRNLLPGENVGYTLSAGGVFGFSGAVALSVSGVPPGSSSTLTPASITPGASSSLRVYTSAATPAGLHTLTVTGTSGALTHSVVLTLNVKTATDFTLLLNPTVLTVAPGETKALSISLTADASVSGGVALSVSGLGKGLQATFSPPTVQVGAASALIITADDTAQPGSSTLTITGVGGGLTRSAEATLMVGSGEEPEVVSVSPDSFVGGGRTVLQISGNRFSGATVSIATEQADPDHPVNRVFPSARVVSINGDGTSMQVEIDASDPRIIDFYNVVIDNGAGRAAATFRVLPPGPLVDAWSPEYPEVGGLYLLSLAGRHLRGVTVTPDTPNRVSLFGVDASEDDRVNALLEVSAQATTGPLNLIVEDAFGRRLEISITIVSAGGSRIATHDLTTRVTTDPQGSDRPDRVPSVRFQDFTVRRPETTRVVEGGVKILASPIADDALHSTRPTTADKSGVFSIFFSYRQTLVKYFWAQTFLFDPQTGDLGDAILQGLGLGDRVRIGAFSIAFYLNVDLVIKFGYTFGGSFTFPTYCIEITLGIQVTGTNGFAFHRSYCDFFGWEANGTGGVSQGTITGGDCASAEPEGIISDGNVFSTVQQDQCCPQEIGANISGNAFLGLPFGRNFDVANPRAGTTSPNAQQCGQCPCSAVLDYLKVYPGSGNVMQGHVRNHSTTDTCTYSWTLKEVEGSQLDVTVDSATDHGTLSIPPGATKTVKTNVLFENDKPAPGPADMKLEVKSADGQCTAGAENIICAVPLGEESTFVSWWETFPSDDARFLGKLLPTSTSFKDRKVTEGPVNGQLGTDTFDHCWQPGDDAKKHYTGLSGGVWTIVSGNRYNTEDSIGWLNLNFDQYWSERGRVPCDQGTTQHMWIFCDDRDPHAVKVEEYKVNKLLIQALPEGTKVSRDGVQTPTFH